MARVLAISSQVARGHVGLSAIVPTLQRLGHEVTALPTILLSNHPGHARFAGERVAAALLDRMIAALAPEGSASLAGEVDAILSGYLPSPEHVAVVEGAVLAARRERPSLPYLCDPVTGDDPKGLYVPQDVAEAIRDRLLPLATIATPNVFELAWMTGRDVGDLGAIAVAASHLAPATVLVTSARDPAAAEDKLSNLLCVKAIEGERQDAVYRADVRRRTGVPNGTGDMASALLLGHLLAGRAMSEALACTVGSLETVIGASLGARELALVASATAWADAPPAHVQRIRGGLWGG
ncbi:MAG TPA: pyridoxal kinase [Hyphomicrobiaceae bacterium]|nr:pyridoxal kinase [Hyphomicrobiaceae bacterium]